jgi:hypothetical protein
MDTSHHDVEFSILACVEPQLSGIFCGLSHMVFRLLHLVFAFEIAVAYTLA